MNAHTHTTHPATRSVGAQRRASISSLRQAPRRLAGWWNDDAMSARFAAARAHDQRMLRRLGGR